jgi:hypothetical protein
MIHAFAFTLGALVVTLSCLLTIWDGKYDSHTADI